MTDYQKAQIIKLRAAGNGYGKIAQTLGISLILRSVMVIRTRNGTSADAAGAVVFGV